MNKNFIKMNDNKNYLSLGNIINLIKDIAKSKSAAMQLELLSVIFNTNEINKTTANNYCTGYRAISLVYKQRFMKLIRDKDNFESVLIKLINILEDKIYPLNNDNLKLINHNKLLYQLCKNIYDLVIIDENIDRDFIFMIDELFINNNLYQIMLEYLRYAIIENKQPLYVQEIKIIINQLEMEAYLKIKLYEGVSYITSLIELAKKGNMYANAELGSLEFSGLITGESNFDVCYNYYFQSALKGHPKGTWMIANLILSKKVNKDISVAWEYLNKAIKLGSVAALNTMGNCYLNGSNPQQEKNVDKAIEYYKKASDKGYVYAFNNLGKIYEKINPDESIKYYLLSADLKESWALNKVGEYYRLKGDLETAYIYYTEATKTPVLEKKYYCYYNLAKYYYIPGNEKLNIVKNLDLAREYLELANNNGIKEAGMLLKKLSIN